jgi:exopolyphosphatase/guanosine-5'-triphosphate,3'-diphosphate pyrophosphatase
MTEQKLVAAVDLGSNSFHMLVARIVDGQVHVVDRLKERVALADGLDEDRRLSKEARERALATLSKFGQRLKHMGHGEVRAVGTNTFRAAKNAPRFLAKAEQALGHPIEVIAGREEARLIYLGVSHTFQSTGGKRLVVDIGGGSTECIIGEGFEPIVADSLYMGHITWQKRFFPDGVLTQEGMAAARTAAALEAESIGAEYRRLGWQGAVGSSGTILAIEAILRDNDWGSTITPKGLKRLRKAIVAAGHVDALAIAGLKEERRPVIAGGVAILSGVFDILEIEEMTTSEGAVREGLVWDMVGESRDEDVRERTVKSFEERYHVDREQAARVEKTALSFFEQTREALGLAGERPARMLRWAARLHEIGVSLSYAGYHKHGAYILEHSDMAGFSRDAQKVLARMVLSHRRKIRWKAFDDLPEDRAEEARKLTLLLRLSYRLSRARSDAATPETKLTLRDRTLSLVFPEGWLEENQLARADLSREADRLQAIGYTLTLA